MSVEKIRTALLDHLVAYAPPWPTAWENTAFRPPRGDAWQQVSLVIEAVEGRGFGDSDLKTWSGHLTIVLHAPLNRGTASVDQRVDGLLQHFHRGRVLGSGGVFVTLDQGRPGDAKRVRDYWIQPVLLPWFAHI
ncbi:MAG: DUF4128 domain-containing protein [Alphaproteobacteria bacterium]|nr:DUF4128 domain-containing protein [Alphaproteobacteria bacterium]